MFTIIDYYLRIYESNEAPKVLRVSPSFAGHLDALKVRHCSTRNDTRGGSTVRSADIDLFPPVIAPRV